MGHMHQWAFKKYVGNKCKVCGFETVAQYECVCGKMTRKKHLCMGKNPRRR